MSSPLSASSELLFQFRQAFADVNLSPTEAQQLRQQLVEFAGQGGDVARLRHELFELAKGRFNTFKDKAVVEWLEAASALLPEQSAPTPATHSQQAQVYFSPGPDCVAAIREFISEARHTLDVCVFTVADDRLTEVLLQAHRRGVRLRLLTDNDKLFDRGSDVRELHAAGVAVRTDCTDNHMHHKFAIADQRTVLTGSYNWTRSAAEYNLENLIITPDPAIVKRYAAEFEKLWAQMKVLEI
ncbi:phospholipase D-like domain-containing protein [Hymenobacter tenuis]